MLAINGFLEWFFLGLLSFLVVAVTLFGLYMAIQLFRNPGRSPRPPPSPSIASSATTIRWSETVPPAVHARRGRNARPANR